VILYQKGEWIMSDDKAAKEKPLEKMTAKELREVAGEIAEITGAHGMNKDELVSAIKKSRGIAETTTRKKSANIRQMKQSIQALKGKRADALAAKDAKQATILKRRISRLKKQIRRAAA